MKELKELLSFTVDVLSNTNKRLAIQLELTNELEVVAAMHLMSLYGVRASDAGKTLRSLLNKEMNGV